MQEIVLDLSGYRGVQVLMNQIPYPRQRTYQIEIEIYKFGQQQPSKFVPNRQRASETLISMSGVNKGLNVRDSSIHYRGDVATTTTTTTLATTTRKAISIVNIARKDNEDETNVDLPSNDFAEALANIIHGDMASAVVADSSLIPIAIKVLEKFGDFWQQFRLYDSEKHGINNLVMYLKTQVSQGQEIDYRIN